MKISNDIKVQKFIDHIKVFDSTKHQILEKLRSIVFDNDPKVDERMMYGGIIFSLKDDFGGVFVYKNHVSFEFGYGYKLSDPEKLLEGGGKYRRHLKIRSMDDIEMIKFEFFIKQIQEFEK